MKKASLILGLAFIANLSFSQEEMKTLFQKDTAAKADTYGGFGAPFVGATQLDGITSVIVGGKGAVIKNHKFAFGGVGTAIIATKESTYTKLSFVVDSLDNNLVNFNGEDSTITEDATRKLSMGYGGIFIEYIFNYDSPIHVSLPLNIQVGGVLAGGSPADDEIQSSSVFVLEPGISFEFNFYKNFIPSLNVGYRYVSGDYSSSLSGVFGSIIFKFGKF